MKSRRDESPQLHSRGHSARCAGGAVFRVLFDSPRVLHAFDADDGGCEESAVAVQQSRSHSDILICNDINSFTGTIIT